MRRLIILVALAAFAAVPASAQKIDKNGRCHDAAGKFAKMEVCKGGAAPRPTARITNVRANASGISAGGPTAGTITGATYRLDAKGKCRDAKGRMAKTELCAARP